MIDKFNQLKLQIINWGITLFLLISICVVGYYLNLEIEKNKVVKKEDIRGVTDLDLIKDGKTMIWLGLKGEFPKFNPKLEARGLGWQEYHVFALKKLLKKEYNLKILERYVTPARLEEEFRNDKRPTCSYPYIWNDPKKEFTKDPKFFYSIGLDFGGEENDQIIFPIEHKVKYLKHLDEQGNLNLKSLLNDLSLKTYIINDVDLGPIVNDVIERDNRGVPKIKTQYQKSIKLMIASDNYQLLKMMKGNRFDYTFNRFITPYHYTKANIEPNQFGKLTYRRENVNSAQDPKLLAYSIRCNFTPFTNSLMPIINDFVDKTRSAGWKISMEKYRTKVEEGYYYELSSWDTIHGRLRAAFATKEIDWWYPIYQQKLALKSFKPHPIIKRNAQVTLDKSPQKSSYPLETKNTEKRIIQGDNSDYYILDRGDLNALQSNIYSYEINLAGWQSMSLTSLGGHLENMEHETLLAKRQTDTFTKNSFDLSQNLMAQAKSLVIYAQGMSEIELTHILNIFTKDNKTKLTSLKIFFPPKKLTKIIYEKLPPDLEKLSLVGVNMLDFPLYNKIVKLPLIYLDLAESIISNADLLKILKAHHLNLKSLNLSHMQTNINQDFSSIFAKLKWDHLEYFNISNSLVSQNVAQNFIKVLPHSLLSLNLKGVNLLPNDFSLIIQKCPNLKTLKVSDAAIINSNNNPIYLPTKLEVFEAQRSLLGPKQIEKIRFPSTLNTLILSENSLLPQGIQRLENNLKQTAAKLKVLHLNNVKANHKSIISLLSNIDISGINDLGLDTSRLNSHFSKLLLKMHQLQALNLKNNLLDDGLSIALLDIFRKNRLKEINIGENAFSKNGLNSIIKGLPLYLEELHLPSVLDLDASFLSKNIPTKLRLLNIHNNKLDRQEVLSILLNLPNSIEDLYLSGNSIEEAEILRFAQILPVNCSSLTMKQDNAKNNHAFLYLVKKLPAFFKSLAFSQNSKPDLSANSKANINSNIIFPKSLESLSINFNLNKQEMPLLSKLPTSLRDIHISVPITKDTLVALSQSINQTNLTTAVLFFMPDKSKDYIQNVELLYSKIPESMIYFEPFSSPVASIFPKLFSKNMKNNSFLLDNGSSLNNISFPLQNYNFNHVKAFYLTGNYFNDQTINYFCKLKANQLVILTIDNSKMTQKGIINLLKSVGNNLYFLSFQSSELSLEGVDEVIKHIPSGVLMLNISGSKIGELGYEKFRQWKKRMDEKQGTDIGLIE